ncbi:MAG: fibrobacter succinogenes major paralogous domain-containing protein [Crocinitomicaceae bacterium]
MRYLMKKLNWEMIVTKKYQIILLFSVFCLISCEKDSSHPLYIKGGGVYDVEGNFYETVVIGDQEWMAENLASMLYCNGDSIPFLNGNEYVKIYENNLSKVNTYGLHYNYLAVEDTAGLCPCGWSVPTELEYAKLINYLGGFVEAMQKMKSVGTLKNGNGLWVELDKSNRLRGDNSSGFNAVPSGIIFYDQFMLRDTIATFWATSDGFEEIIYYEIGNTNYVGKQTYPNSISYKEVFYYSVRCIKNFP